MEPGDAVGGGAVSSVDETSCLAGLVSGPRIFWDRGSQLAVEPRSLALGAPLSERCCKCVACLWSPQQRVRRMRFPHHSPAWICGVRM